MYDRGGYSIMHCRTSEIKEAIKRWVNYGWECKIIRHNLCRFYGIDAPRERIQIIIEKVQKYKK